MVEPHLSGSSPQAADLSRRTERGIGELLPHSQKQGTRTLTIPLNPLHHGRSPEQTLVRLAGATTRRGHRTLREWGGVPACATSLPRTGPADGKPRLPRTRRISTWESVLTPILSPSEISLSADFHHPSSRQTCARPQGPTRGPMRPPPLGSALRPTGAKMTPASGSRPWETIHPLPCPVPSAASAA